jgi:hypothetical protein
MIAISSTGNKTHLIYCPLKIGVFSILNIHPMAKQKKRNIVIIYCLMKI